MTPQELMDIDGAGNAEKQMKKEGMWDEYAGLPQKWYHTSCLVTSFYSEDIEARTTQEAKDKLIACVNDEWNMAKSYEIDDISVEEEKT